ncbi:MAG: hypothetical protein ACM3NS_09645 [Deltaproteobacteria bacterium]
MRRRPGGPLALLLALAAGAAGCSERLTQPGQCPELCPGGTPVGQEEILTALPDNDSSFTGYTEASASAVMLVGSGIPTPADTSYGVLRFTRPDSVTYRDTLRAYTVDSAQFTMLVVAHDTAVHDARLQLYRLPSSIDTTALSYAALAPLFTPANFVGEMALPDTATADTVRLKVTGAAVGQIAIQPSDSGKLAIGIAIVGGTPTGGRVGNHLSVLPPSLLTYITPVAASPSPVSIGATTDFAGYITRQTPAVDPALLTVGGVPSSRVLIRFPWSARLRDSVTIVRATLELVPAQPTEGLPNDPGTLNVRGLATDFGAKSPVEPLSLGAVSLPANTTDTVRVEIATVVRFWQAGLLRPPAMFVSISPEVETFTRAVFGSSRTGAAAQIRLNYLPRFPFSSP